MADERVRLCYGVCIGGAQEVSLGEGGRALLPTFAELHAASAIACANMLKVADPEGEPVQILVWTDDAGDEDVIRDSLKVADALDTCRAVAEVLRRDREAHLAAQQRREAEREYRERMGDPDAVLAKAQREAAQDDPRGERDR